LLNTVNPNPSASELRKFGGSMLIGFGVIGAILWYVGPEPNSLAYQAVRPQKVAIALWCLGAALLVASFGPRSFARVIFVVWMTAAMKIGVVMTFILLSALFVVLLPWFSFIRFRDPLGMKLKPEGESYWQDHTDQAPELDRVARPF